MGGKYAEVVRFSDASREQNSCAVAGSQYGPRYQAQHQTHKGCHPAHGGAGICHHGREG